MSNDNYRTREERRKQKKENNKKNKNKKVTMKKILISLSIAFLVMILAGGITAFAIIRDAPELDPDRLILAQNPQILDREEQLITTLDSGENRRLASIDEMPQVLIDAVISVEDIRFYDHFGIDMRRIGGAVIANITRGFGAEGASTITQQLIKNLFLDMNKNWTRKIQEQYLAIRLEQQYTKDEILEMYLNTINFSGSRYGVVEAADFFFNKDLSELTIEDAALLAGIPQRPNYFNAFINPEPAENRRNTVISLMERYEKITPEQAESARNVPIEDQLNQSERETYAFQAFIDQVLNEVEAIDGIEASDIYTTGLKIYTTLDQDLQRHVEHVMQSGEVINFPDEFYQAGVTLMDTKTGQVLAIGGMRKPAEGVRGWNWATNPRRQPGSTIKPILDYGPVIEKEQWSTGHIIVDEPYAYSDGTPVHNFNRNQYKGRITMREALRDSQNTTAVKAFHEVGIDYAKAFGEKLGLNLDTIEEPYSIGGFSRGLSSYQMAGAYGAFGNNGEYNKPHTVTKIEFPNGQTIDLTPDPVIAMNDYTAFMISDMLKTVVQSGTGTQAAISGVPIAGKTGSSNFTEEERERFNIGNGIKDSWFAGYSTELTAAVWTGYDTPADGYIQYVDNQQHIAKYIFREVMSYAHQGRETSDFVQPDSVVRIGIERETGLLPSDFTPDDKIIYEYFVRGTEPQEISDEYEEVESVEGLEAIYNDEDHEIHVQWNYAEDLLERFSFQIEIREGSSGNYSLADITKDLHFTIENPEYDTTYSIRVTAISDEDEDLVSDPASVNVTVPEEEVDIPDEIIEEDPPEEEQDPPVEDEPSEDQNENNDNEEDNDGILDDLLDDLIGDEDNNDEEDDDRYNAE
ncbi:PBP1A family penicillin-binding protein [Evansella sp. AB-P1]|uniref:transglycosylase domain-containing protein n=1 Tax=Evansella sp. AB-P1 TaxID=3037653 RepID=UPI00241DA21F|nr:penicillin-binding protein 1A [Evansella sp. AB-P1]MDG5787552.1 PBP1A family penicillin-binding protein [Evansella sp. AB-P1]